MAIAIVLVVAGSWFLGVHGRAAGDIGFLMSLDPQPEEGGLMTSNVSPNTSYVQGFSFRQPASVVLALLRQHLRVERHWEEQITDVGYFFKDPSDSDHFVCFDNGAADPGVPRPKGFACSLIYYRKATKLDEYRGIGGALIGRKP